MPDFIRIKNNIYWIGALVLCCIYLIFKILNSTDYTVDYPDTSTTYLPLAELFIQDPLAALRSEKAITVAPGSYIYMALFGAEKGNVLIANMILAVISVFIIFDTVRRLFNKKSALLAAFFYAVSPTITEVIVPALSEPPYIFFTLVWLWSLSLIYTYPDKKWPVVLSGVSLFLSIITRGIFFYWTIAALCICAAMYFLAKRADVKKFAVRVAFSHVITAVGLSAVVVHNDYFFNTPMIATGSGAALYFGNDVVTHGYEPQYVGLLHQEWMIIDGKKSHLAPENDARLKYAALERVKDTPLKELAIFYINKLGVNLFFSKEHLNDYIINKRTLRISLIILALYGCFILFHNPVVVMYFFITAYAVAVLIPVMYNQRYSIGNIDLLLVIMAGMGTALLFSKSFKTIMFVFALIFALSVIGGLHIAYSHPLVPNTSNRHVKMALLADENSIGFNGLEGNPFIDTVHTIDNEASITWSSFDDRKKGGVPILQIDIEKLDSRCRKVHFKYTADGIAPRVESLRLDGFNSPGLLNFGTQPFDRLGHKNGSITVTFECPIATEMKFNSMALYLSQAGRYYRERLPEELKVIR
ncbi:MAG: ArnT family glycosyltransferase [Marinobacterium sp.]